MEDKLRVFRKMVDEQALKGIHVSKTEELKILRNLNRKTKQGNKLQYYISSIAALLLMSIIGYSFLNDLTGRSDDSNNQTSSINASSGSNANVSGNIINSTPSNEDVTVTFSAAEQELIQNINGMKALVLSSNAFIPLEKINEISKESGQPKIEVTKNTNNVILVKATFPMVEEESVILKTEENKYGSAKNASETLSSGYPDAKPLSISGMDALLIATNGESEVLIFDEKYVYSISGASSSVLSGIAEQIVFSE